MQKTRIQERRALWFSYLDWALLDMENAERFRASVEGVLDSCAGLGLDTLILHVRPFADALYQSDLYPWSHLLTGVQGEAPGFDPLDSFLEQAHRRKLRVEAWVNPYRIRLNRQLPAGVIAVTHGSGSHVHDDAVIADPRPFQHDVQLFGKVHIVCRLGHKLMSKLPGKGSNALIVFAPGGKEQQISPFQSFCDDR